MSTYTDKNMWELEESGFAESELKALELLKNHLGIALSVSGGALYMGRIDEDTGGLPCDIWKIGFIYDGSEPEPYLFLNVSERFGFPGLRLLVKRYYGIDIPEFKSTTELKMKLELRGEIPGNPPLTRDPEMV